MGRIPQVELDKLEYWNELAIVPLLLYRRGGLEEVYEKYNGIRMLKPKEHFRRQYGHGPAKKFPLAKANELVDSFNSQLKQRGFTDESFGQHIAQGYALSGKNMSDDVKALFGMV